MPDILVRNVPQETVDALKRQAKRHGRSLQAEVMDVLEKEIRGAREDIEELLARARRESTGHTAELAADIIRRDRERNG